MPRGVYTRGGAGAATATAREVIAPLQKQTERTKYLYDLVDQVKSRFNLPIPNLCIGMGFPSRRARGRFSSRAVGEVIVQEWKDSDNIEKAFLVIHPERFVNSESVALSVLLLVGDEIYGSRRHSGALTLGVTISKETGAISYTADDKGKHAHTTLRTIIRELGDMPKGHIELPEPPPRQATRMAKYACNVCGRICRAAADPEAMHTADRGTYVLAPARTRRVTAQPAATQPTTTHPVAAAPAAQPLTQRQNIENLGKLVEAGAARISAPRAFGV